jgi:hypothetical protein
VNTSRCIAGVFFLAIFAGPVCGQDIQRADNLGDEFQKQMPYSKEKPQSGETPGQPQPEHYVAPPERERPDAAQPPGNGYPLCYNPYYGRYEPCYPEGSEQWRHFYSSPHFQLWWDKWRSCPSGHHFRIGKGCFRN